STGMLVIRAWLANNPERRKYLKHLVGLAPATWGSPLAQMGNSVLGSIVRGNHQFGPDFLNAGTLVLDALEIGSKFTWDLAHRDILGPEPLFTTDPSTPYVAIFIGNTAYSGIKELVDKPGTDGTVRWSGCSLNTRKLIVDLTKPAAGLQAQMMPWPEERLSVPMFAVDGKNHTTLLLDPGDDLADRVAAFFAIDSGALFNSWVEKTSTEMAPALEKMKQNSDGWQQFIVHVMDEFGEGAPDYAIDVFNQDPRPLDEDALAAADIEIFDADVHAYQLDQSFRCFHVQLPQGFMGTPQVLWIRLLASSGTDLISYRGYDSAGAVTVGSQAPIVLDISHLAAGADALFCPFTTTLIEIRLNRLPSASVMTVGPYASALTIK
ncbi:MAG TPA: hypothetical protein VHY79_06080, partial [Rhizomicrobium sp.]|nr:hypothetical protein [Rhizomicrobium sp.]